MKNQILAVERFKSGVLFFLFFAPSLVQGMDGPSRLCQREWSYEEKDQAGQVLSQKMGDSLEPLKPGGCETKDVSIHNQMLAPSSSDSSRGFEFASVGVQVGKAPASYSFHFSQREVSVQPSSSAPLPSTPQPSGLPHPSPPSRPQGGGNSGLSVGLNATQSHQIVTSLIGLLKGPPSRPSLEDYCARITVLDDQLAQEKKKIEACERMQAEIEARSRQLDEEGPPEDTNQLIQKHLEALEASGVMDSENDGDYGEGPWDLFLDKYTRQAKEMKKNLSHWKEGPSLRRIERDMRGYGWLMKQRQELEPEFKTLHGREFGRELGFVVDDLIEVGVEGLVEGSRRGAEEGEGFLWEGENRDWVREARIIGLDLLDFAVSASPAGVAKDVYEGVTGRGLFTGEALNELERGSAVAGVLTFGATSKFKAVNQVLVKVGKSLRKRLGPLWARKGLGASIGEGERIFESVRGEVTRPIQVTQHGVALPPGKKIPDSLIENPFRSGSYGELVAGKFIEKLRIDPATAPGKKGPTYSHYHKKGKRDHFAPRPDSKDPGF